MIPKIVLVGVGRFGKNHLETLLNLEKKGLCKLIGIVEIEEKLQKEIKIKYKIQVSQKLEDFIKIADAFDVVTPPNTHFKIVKYLLKNGKNVFVEKPITTKFSEAKKLSNIAKKKKVILQVGHISRYNSTVKYLKKMLTKKINQPFLIKAEFLQNRMQSHNTSAIFIFMHGLDIIDFIIEKNVRRVVANSNLIKRKLDLNSSIMLQYDNLNAYITLGWIPSGIERKIELFSEKRHILCDLMENSIQIFEEGSKTKKIKIKSKEPFLTSELKDFIKCVKYKKNSTVNGEIGSRIVKICELSIKSVKQNMIK